jgi:hypothetical protein
VAQAVHLQVQAINAAFSGASGSRVMPDLVLPVNGWVRLVAEGIVAGADQAFIRLDLDTAAAGGPTKTPFAVGHTYDLTGAMVVEGPKLPAYFDGGSAGAKWTGTAGSSVSVGWPRY